ncbi:MAG TPA: tetratricopeptide repeat protein [Bacteroidales bacterium]|nr:tetratricopeptide repeat protein [Bacteroidales bacterium]
MKREYSSILKLLAVLALAIMPLIFFAQEATGDEGDEQAQTEQKTKGNAYFQRYGYVGGSLGGVAFHGDIYSEPLLPDWDHFNWGFGGIAGWQFHPIFGLRASGGYVNLSGERYGDVDRAFKGDAFDVGANLTISLTNLIFGYSPDRWFDMTLWSGLGMIQYRTKMRVHSTAEWLESRGWGDDPPYDNGDGKGINNRNVATAYPVGLDFDFILSDHWNINVNTSMKFSDTDGMDAYAHATAAVKRDFWHYTGIGLTYKFGQGGIKQMAKDFDDIKWEATPNPLEVHGDVVKVTITGDFPPKYFQKGAAMYVTPVLRYEGGAVAYEPFTIKGEEVAGDGMAIPYKEGGTITYTGEIPYSPELNASELFLVPIIYDAKEGTLAKEEDVLNSKKYIIVPDVKVNDGVIHTSRYILNDENPIIAFHAYEKETILSKDAKIFFLINRHNLNWNIPLNKLEENKAKLAEFREFIALGYKIKDIQIVGWASPEGEELFNKDLSENRANTAYDYLVKEMKKMSKDKESRFKCENPKENISWNITWQGPDWDGFMDAVKASSIQDKDAILNVIKSADQAKREEEIRNMILIYPELEENILPPLRRTVMTVNSYEPKRPDEQIMAYGLSQPDSLKINELLYAATFYENDADKLAVYKNALKYYPKCYRAHNNAGVVLTDMGKYDEAASMFAKAQELKPEYGAIDNNMGVLACKQGKYDEAKQHFMEAQKKGEDVTYNTGVLAILDGDYSKAESSFSGKECTHNLGLVQLLNQDYPTAQKTFECAPEEALTYYLLAITGSRQDNTQLMLDNLMKAIEKDPELKNEAKYDREFIKYFDLPEFQAIVK